MFKLLAFSEIIFQELKLTLNKLTNQTEENKKWFPLGTGNVMIISKAAWKI